MHIIEFLKNRYAQVLLAALVCLILGFTSGYSYKADKVEVERLKEYKVVAEKLDKIYKFSIDESKESKDYIDLTDSKLQAILLKVSKKQIPLTSVPCVPSEEFSKKWEEINNADAK